MAICWSRVRGNVLKAGKWTGKFLIQTAMNGFKAGLTGDIRKMKPVIKKKKKK